MDQAAQSLAENSLKRPNTRSPDHSNETSKRARQGSPEIKVEQVVANPSVTTVGPPEAAAPATASTPDSTTYAGLVQLHKSLCTIYTFLSARPHFLASFDTLAATISKQIGRELQHIDIARLKCIIPRDLLFGFVVIEPEDAMSLQPGAEPEEGTLLIEFVDGKLKASGKDSDGDAPLDFARWKSLRVPSYGIKSVQKLIHKRTTRFETNLNKYVKTHGESWPEKLDEEARRYVPRIIEEDTMDPVEAMITAVKHHGSAEGGHTRFDIPKFVKAMKKSPEYSGQIVEGGEFIVGKQEAVYQELHNPLPAQLSKALSEYLTSGEKEPESIRLYAHQAEAINQLEAGYNVVVATSTSSGKSLIYQIPILRALLEYHTHGQDSGRHPPTAIFMFPTKALAQDQMRSFNALKFLVFDSLTASTIVAETYDGDTPHDERRRIRETASVIFTNPDMLHANVIPNWESPDWKRFLGGLRYVVVDELHTYTGAFGAHVGYVMRRLRRVYEHCAENSDEEFKVISCSATISEPAKVS